MVTREEALDRAYEIHGFPLRPNSPFDIGDIADILCIKYKQAEEVAKKLLHVFKQSNFVKVTPKSVFEMLEDEKLYNQMLEFIGTGEVVFKRLKAAVPESEIPCWLKPANLHSKIEKDLCSNKYNHHLNWVYFVTDGEFVKVGRATDLEARLSGLQVGNARKLDYLFAIKLKSSEACKRVEEWMHEEYAAHHIRGEWFDILRYIDVEKFMAEFESKYLYIGNYMCA